MRDRLAFYWNRIRERLWFKPLLVSVLSVAGAFLANAADTFGLDDRLPQVDAETNDSLLTIMASSMLVIATFAVASMVSAYASASSTATPRAFPLIVADDASQNALSSFIGAFIFSLVALIAVKNNYYGDDGQFVLFSLTLLVFAWVVLTFVRWVDRIARLGRIGNVIDRVEAAAARSLERRRRQPTLRGREQTGDPAGEPVCAERVGYVQHVAVERLQEVAARADCRVAVTALPGTFATPDRPLFFLAGEADADARSALRSAFRIDDERVFDEDPRFGLIVLSEIAARALSPAVNDPGTAISIIGTFVRLFEDWVRPGDGDHARSNGTTDGKEDGEACDRVSVPRLAVTDMFDDAFTAVARDGAGTIEVQVRLQKAFRALAAMGDPALAAAARQHSQRALAHAEQCLAIEDEIAIVRKLALAGGD
ncbi:MAG TPA: DUF2254 domain-containing protein [Woeseiaceae bacterium]|nr:DUF2254 domain-containing protein [Woeseiaceae bacterium]